MRGPQQNPMHGDCRQLLALQPDNHYHFCVTDNPYGLTEMTKRFGGEEAKPAQYGTDGAFSRVSAGFMGQEWDGTQIEIDQEFWKLLWTKMRPGAHLLAFGGSRTFHRIAVAIEDAGFVLRDTIQVLGWTYATGMPHSENVGKGFDLIALRKWVKFQRPKYIGKRVERIFNATPSDQWAWKWREVALHLYGEIPGLRPVVALKDGVGGENLNDIVNGRDVRQNTQAGGRGLGSYGVGAKQTRKDVSVSLPQTPESQVWDGYGSGLCPSWEAILLFQKPTGKGLSIAENCRAWGCGALNIDGCRVAGEIRIGSSSNAFTDQAKRNFDSGHSSENYYEGHETPPSVPHLNGRWPKNTVLLHHPLCERIAEALPPRRLTAVMTPNDHELHRQQNSDEKAQFKYERGEDEWECHPDCRIGSTFNKSAGCFPQFSTIIDPGEGFTPILYTKKPGKTEKEAGLDDLEPLMVRRTNPGGLENEPRWAPVSKKNTHPTVKSLELMRWLIRLASPPPECEPIGVDPFMGSGTTLCAAAYEGVSMDGMEQDARSHRIAIGRINHHEAIAAAKRPTPPPLTESPKIKRELVRRPMVRAREREAA